MIKCIHNSICFLSVVLVLSLPAFGKEESDVRLKFVSFPKVSDPQSVELLIGENKTIEVELPTDGLSEAYKVPALATWELGKSSSDERGESQFDSYGKVNSLGAEDQLIIVVRKGLTDSDGFELKSLGLSEKGFDGGKYFLLNATRVDIGGTIGTAKFALRPGDSIIIAPEPTTTREDSKYCYAKILFRNKQEVQPFLSSTWRFNEKARSMVFFYHDTHNDRLRMHTIRDYLP